MRFSTDGERDTGRTGAACFAPLWRGDAFDLMVPQESVCALLTNHRGHVADVTHAGNELADASFRMLAALAEDLNADGHVDLYVLSSSDSQPNCLYVNRGYGSFMQVEKYKRDIFPGEAARIGAWGAAAGDVNGDGANDLLLGGVNGKLTLLVNDTLSLRKGVENPTRQDRKLLATCIVSARVSGRIGVLGARVSLADAAGRVVGLRQIGSSVLTGCRGPDTVNLAVREPGRHVLTVRFSHGLLRKWELEVGEEARIVLNADRGDGR
jgi:hypothetical protein